jgi:hypothetical protein
MPERREGPIAGLENSAPETSSPTQIAAQEEPMSWKSFIYEVYIWAHLASMIPHDFVPKDYLEFTYKIAFILYAIAHIARPHS